MRLLNIIFFGEKNTLKKYMPAQRTAAFGVQGETRYYFLIYVVHIST